MILNLLFFVLSYLPTGVPNISGASTASTTNYLAVKKGYVMSYNGVEGRANWVGWTLQFSDLGSVERSNRFREDSDLPRQFKRIDHDDYRESGYDRGHLCNSEDRTSSEYLNEETFLMSNMIPQTPELNRGPFKFLEAYCRKLVLKKGQKLLIYSGGIGAKGRLTSGVPIPQYCWKAIYTPTEEIYVLFPNERTLEKNWNKYRVTKDRLEKMTGFQFP
ncbi:DNA/RNA non-specific endonuclease [Aquirufa sp.]|jgi:endonuclease G|uniref:DNA/RNA non-specific endonuclease n=1 Tax=Aquirufa sp. TaxID=2676249 RepID=UPI0037BEFC68